MGTSELRVRDLGASMQVGTLTFAVTEDKKVDKKRLKDNGHNIGRYCWCNPVLEVYEGEWVVNHRDVTWQ